MKPETVLNLKYGTHGTVRKRDEKLGYHLKKDEKYIMEPVRARLRERLTSLDGSIDYCDKHGIVYKELPLWVDDVSFNEYTGEHRGDFAPLGKVKKMISKEYIQCPHCGSSNIRCLDGSDKAEKSITVEICPEMYLCTDCGETFRLDEVGELKLEITEIAWGINRMTGKKSESVSGHKSFPCKPGELPQVGADSRRFAIDKVTDKSIVLSVHTAVEKYNKTWTLKKGDTIKYRPLSYDGGHYFEVKLK